MSQAIALQPVYLVKGSDPALMEQAAHDLILSLAGDANPQLVVEEFDAEEVEAGTVIDACSTPPFFNDRRVVVLRQAGRLGASDAAAFAEYLDAPLDSTALVLVAGGGAVPAKLADAAKRSGQVLDTGVKTGRARTEWLTSRLRAAPIQIDPAAASVLADHLGEDLWRLAGILDALSVAYGEGARLGIEELQPFLGQAGSLAPWELTDAIDRGDIEASLSVLHRMLGAGARHPLVVMASLHNHYANMLRLDGATVGSEEDAAVILGIKSAFRARKLLSQGRRLGTDRLTRAITLLAQADMDLRGMTAWPEELVMEVLVARLSRLSPRQHRAPA